MLNIYGNGRVYSDKRETLVNYLITNGYERVSSENVGYETWAKNGTNVALTKLSINLYIIEEA